MKIIALRDAFSQTSDNETRDYKENSPHISQKIHQNVDNSREDIERVHEKKKKLQKLHDFPNETTSKSTQEQCLSFLAEDTEEGISKSVRIFFFKLHTLKR